MPEINFSKQMLYYEKIQRTVTDRLGISKLCTV